MKNTKNVKFRQYKQLLDDTIEVFNALRVCLFTIFESYFIFFKNNKNKEKFIVSSLCKRIFNI